MGPQARDDRDRYWKAFGAWVRKRLSEQTPDRWTQVRLRDELADIGIRVKREWVNQVINGKPPSDDLRRGIERLLGVFPEPDSDAPDLSQLIEAIHTLVEEMRLTRAQEKSSRTQQVASTDAILRALAAVLPGAPTPPGTPDQSGTGAPAGSGQ